MRTYGGLARFIVQMGSPVVDGLKRLEANKINATAFGLRNLEQLLTPSSREELMVTFSNPDAKMQDLDRAIQRARHSMWCGFVWSEHPDIDPGKRMPFVSLLPLHTSIHIFLKNKCVVIFWRRASSNLSSVFKDISISYPLAYSFSPKSQEPTRGSRRAGPTACTRVRLQ
jgi:hypothetical protein